jgi:hypothetical protein
MLTKPIYYMQTDPRWKSIMYSHKSLNDPGQTIGGGGCGPTCAAMVIQTLRDNGVTPKETAAWSVAHGYRAKTQGTEFAYFVPQLAEYGIYSEYTWDYGKALNGLKEGYMVIGRATKGLWTSAGHFILAYTLDGGQNYIFVNDPNSSTTSRSLAPLQTFKQQVSPFWVVREEWKMREEDIERVVRRILQGTDTPVPAGAFGDEYLEAVRMGITDGTRPGGYATRAEAAVMNARVAKKIKS